MRVDPELDEVVNGDRGMLRGIDACLETECLVSAVTLIFAAIDALSALTRPKSQSDTNREIFIDLVDKYMRPQQALNCRSVDLYSARCGVLYTHMPDSRLTRQGEARPIVYQWRSGPAADSSAPLPEGALVIEIEDLDSAFRKAVQRFLKASDAEISVKNRVEHHLKTLLCYRPWPQVFVRAAA